MIARLGVRMVSKGEGVWERMEFEILFHAFGLFVAYLKCWCDLSFVFSIALAVGELNP